MKVNQVGNFKIIKLLFLLQLLLSGLLLTGCSQKSRVQNKGSFNYSKDKPIEGQIETAKQLKVLMDEQKYDLAINLFSERIQKEIMKIKEDDDLFKYWCTAWTLNASTLDRYLDGIKKGEGRFVFEDNMWKIDEK